MVCKCILLLLPLPLPLPLLLITYYDYLYVTYNLLYNLLPITYSSITILQYYSNTELTQLHPDHTITLSHSLFHDSTISPITYLLTYCTYYCTDRSLLCFALLACSLARSLPLIDTYFPHRPPNTTNLIHHWLHPWLHTNGILLSSAYTIIINCCCCYSSSASSSSSSSSSAAASLHFSLLTRSHSLTHSLTLSTGDHPPPLLLLPP